MKCRMAVFEPRQSINDLPEDMAEWEFPVRTPVECGGEIVHAPDHYYCDECGVRYEKLPEDEGDE